MSRPAPLVSKRPQPSTAAVGGTSLGTPLKTRTVALTAESPAAAASSSSSAAAAPYTPNRVKPASAIAASPSASSTAAGRTPKPVTQRGFGSSVPSSVVPASLVASASSPMKANSSAASASSASSSSTPNRKPHPSAAASPRVLSRQRYDSTKATDPFASKTKFRSSFSEAYINGRVPCRINHGSVRHTLQWDRPSSELDFNFLLPCMADGIVETEHPYQLIARQGFAELVAEAGACGKLLPLLPKLVQPLRRALMDPAAGVFEAGCDAIIALSASARDALTPHLDLLLQQVNKRSLSKGFQSKVLATITALAENGGEGAAAIIKQRVPGFII